MDLGMHLNVTGGSYCSNPHQAVEPLLDLTKRTGFWIALSSLHSTFPGNFLIFTPGPHVDPDIPFLLTQLCPTSHMMNCSRHVIIDT